MTQQSTALIPSDIKLLFVTAILSLAILAAPSLGTLTASGQGKTPGLTGTDRPDDVVMARQLVMDGVEEEMMAIEAPPAGKEPALSDLTAHAYRISTLLTVFPHLFPPQTKPVAAADGSPSTTAATAKIWENFDDFYAKSLAGATLAYDASQAENLDKFRENATKLRAACDGCHAQYMRVDEPPKP
jgi:cytochrome c556